MKHRWVYLYPLVYCLYAIYSYSQTAPNLVLSSNPLFWHFQLSLWQLGYHQRGMSVLIYTILLLLLFASYIGILSLIRRKDLSLKQTLGIWLGCLVALVPSYPGLSNDIFNYLMNAKMMHVYQASPYIHAAWDFPDDPWLKFMMNVHTPTPYGVVWTWLGYVMYFLARGDLQFGMLMFRLLAIGATSIVGWGIYTLKSQGKVVALASFLLNPLILLEAVNNAHNDMTMMAWLFAGLLIWNRFQQSKRITAALLFTLCWIASVYTKLVTVITPAVMAGYYVTRRWTPWFKAADWLTLALFAAMYADGAKRFFPWYLLWGLSFAPLSHSRLVKEVAGAFSFSGLLSYSVFLSTGEYTLLTGQWRLAIFFGLPIVYVIMRVALLWQWPRTLLVAPLRVKRDL